MADDDSLCPLHKCIFNGDIRKLSQLLRTNDPSAKDKHGEWKVIDQTNPSATGINIQIPSVGDCFDIVWHLLSLSHLIISPLHISNELFEFCFVFPVFQQEIHLSICRSCWDVKVCWIMNLISAKSSN